ncbi:TnsA-like heteromeric transposase endonuclease subunit [Pseudonocardia sp. TRM90224]|uniref:TnsA-like heteromeric transposase endonuclease subunit n=1 Tax=Pseudonocardia sp. TRM90224 TaxID=2812678 RepID=UPI001E530632|nr:TnsA-like heteromeric transposase endonuclease subunit [Pseudonocardia sp. TRM90224]
MGGVAAAVSVRLPDGNVVEGQAWDEVSTDLLASAEPWRTFRWLRGQKHYSGTYWASTVRRHVIYESRLELARLLYADFDPAVRHVLAQPFLLKAKVHGEIRKHVPDYLLISDNGPVVVDVKPYHRVSRPEVAFTFDWTRRVVLSRGWRYEVWTEPPVSELENIRFLAGYRRDWLFSTEVVERVRSGNLDGVSLGHAVAHIRDYPEQILRAAVLHLLWKRELTVDLSRPLSPSSVLSRVANET